MHHATSLSVLHDIYVTVKWAKWFQGEIAVSIGISYHMFYKRKRVRYFLKLISLKCIDLHTLRKMYSLALSKPYTMHDI